MSWNMRGNYPASHQKRQKHFLFFLLWRCVCVCACRSERRAQRLTSVTFSITHYIISLRQSLLLKPGFTDSARLSGQWALGILLLASPYWYSIWMFFTLLLFIWMLGTKCRSSCWCDKSFIDWPTSLVPRNIFLLTVNPGQWPAKSKLRVSCLPRAELTWLSFCMGSSNYWVIIGVCESKVSRAFYWWKSSSTESQEVSAIGSRDSCLC